MEEYDIIIIGGGPAGLTAGIYAGRRNLKTLILSKTLGGQMAWAHMIENYSGLDPMSGLEMAERMRKQAEKFGCTYKMETVASMQLKEKKKVVKTKEGEYSSKVVIITTGSQYRKLGAEGEEKFIGKGVSYCTICDGPLFAGKKVAVIGGSDSAVMSAVFLASLASETYLVHRKDKLRAEQANQEKLEKAGVKVIWNSNLEKVEGDNVVKKMVLKDSNTNEEQAIDIDGIFIEVGEVPTTELVKSAGIEVTDRNFIKVNDKFETNIPGVYAAGDVAGTLAQVIVAAAGGAVAATNAYLWINGGFYGEKPPLDYGEKK